MLWFVTVELKAESRFPFGDNEMLIGRREPDVSARDRLIRPGLADLKTGSLSQPFGERAGESDGHVLHNKHRHGQIGSQRRENRGQHRRAPGR